MRCCLLLLSAVNVTFSSIAQPNIGSAVGGEVNQIKSRIIGCAVVDQAIVIGSQPGTDACLAKGNLVIGDIAVVSSCDPKSHHSTFSDSVAFDSAMSAQSL